MPILQAFYILLFVVALPIYLSVVDCRLLVALHSVGCCKAGLRACREHCAAHCALCLFGVHFTLIQKKQAVYHGYGICIKLCRLRMRATRSGRVGGRDSIVDKSVVVLARSVSGLGVHYSS
jgi:hypothetical protein